MIAKGDSVMGDTTVGDTATGSTAIGGTQREIKLTLAELCGR